MSFKDLAVFVDPDGEHIIGWLNPEFVRTLTWGGDPNKPVVEGEGQAPYEIHLVSFPEEKDFIAFGKDPERASFLHLKEASVERIELIKGVML